MFVAPEEAQANAMMMAGHYAEAAPLYERGAIAAHGAGDFLSMKLSAHLALKAYSRADDPKNALRFSMATVDALKGAGLVRDVPGFAVRCLEVLRTQGQAAEADALSAHVGQVVGAAWNDPNAPKLPAFCASCGAAVKPTEIVRPTPSTVACAYCGASLAR